MLVAVSPHKLLLPLYSFFKLLLFFLPAFNPFLFAIIRKTFLPLYCFLPHKIIDSASCMVFVTFLSSDLSYKAVKWVLQGRQLYTQETATLPTSTGLKSGWKQHWNWRRPLERSWQSGTLFLLDSSFTSSRKLWRFNNLFILDNDPRSMCLNIYWTERFMEKMPSSFLHRISLKRLDNRWYMN